VHLLVFIGYSVIIARTWTR